MAKKDSKSPRQKRTEPLVPVTTDPRFSSVHSDPRFRLPKSRDRKITVDSRFKKVLTDDEFVRKAKVDKYGRKLPTDARREEIKRFYTFEDDDEKVDDEDEEEGVVGVDKSSVTLGRESEDSEEDSDDGDGLELSKPKIDRARGEGVSDLSSEDSSSDDSSDDEVIESEAEELERAQEEADAIPLGDTSSRIAIVNLDWDHITSKDLFVTLNSFTPPSGKLLKVSIYPSEFGKTRMEREEMEGPPKELFSLPGAESSKSSSKSTKIVTRDGNDDTQEIITEQTIIKEDTGEEFNPTTLRNYQLERLRYFYAIAEFDSADSAEVVYTECDGAEFGTTANYFDLRYVPDGTDFDDSPRDECDSYPKNYKPRDFTTDALQHSKVKLTWDQEDQGRKQVVKEAFSRQDIEDMDLQAYIASESEEEDEVAKEAYRKLLNLAPVSEETKKSKEKKPVGDMEVTFTPALMGETSRNEDVIEKDESTIDKYKRKEKERKKQRKEKMKEKRLGESVIAEEEQEHAGESEEDLGFNDPFFEDAEKDTVSRKKADKQKRREEKKNLSAEQAAKREELELLMMEDEGNSKNLQHFNMQNIVKKEKLSKLKGKAAKRLAKKGVADAEGLQDTYEVDVKDPRFSAIYEKTEFAIDPTNPRYKKTQTMEKVMDERRKRRIKDGDNGTDDRKSKKHKKQRS